MVFRLSLVNGGWWVLWPPMEIQYMYTLRPRKYMYLQNFHGVGGGGWVGGGGGGDGKYLLLYGVSVT
jgi:hypothetical protein